MLGTTGPDLTLFSTEEVEEKDEGSMVRLPKTLWERLTTIAKLEDARVRAAKPDAKKISRNDLIKKVLREFADKFEAEQDRKPAKKGH